MTFGAETALIARREIRIQIRSRAFVVGNVVMPALVVVPGDAAVTVLSRDTPDTTLPAAVDPGVTRVAALRYLRADPAAATGYLADTAAPLRLNLLKPADSASLQRWVIAYFGGFVMLLSIVQFGSGICTGVVEEKSSRVVELLLATCGRSSCWSARSSDSAWWASA